MNTRKYATVYSLDGSELTTGLAPSSECDAAIQAAERMADELGEDVELYDDDGVWLVHPADDGDREPADKVREFGE